MLWKLLLLFYSKYGLTLIKLTLSSWPGYLTPS